MISLKELIQHIRNASYILIAGHISPDGDAIGACAAMGLILEQMGKEYGVLLENPDAKYDYLLEHICVLSEVPNKHCDLFIALDCGDAHRLGRFMDAFYAADISYNIDHHISNPHYGKFNYVDVNASSASEIMFSIYKESGIQMNERIAEAIYTGIIYDTAAFKHTNTTSTTLAIASKLLEYPFNFSTIIHTLFYESSFSGVQLQGIAIGNMKSYYNHSLIISTLSQNEIQRCNSQSQEVEGIVNILKNIKNNKIAIFLYEKDNGEVKLSMRAEEPYDVCKIAKVFGGGGHTKAAGATMNMPLEEAKEQILLLVMKLFE